MKEFAVHIDLENDSLKYLQSRSSVEFGNLESASARQADFWKSCELKLGVGDIFRDGCERLILVRGSYELVVVGEVWKRCCGCNYVENLEFDVVLIRNKTVLVNLQKIIMSERAKIW